MLRIEGLDVAYGDRMAVRDLTLDAADGEVLCVLGPSGCGKSTLLRAIAGLEPPVAGSIHLDGRTLDGLRPDQRKVGLMFQDHALFPHRNVHDNVAFGLRMQGATTTSIRERVDEVLDLVGLAGTGPRPVTELSGGERQRVALARSIAPRPRLLMLDEPLGSLDRALQTRLLDELPEVFAALGTTVVYVTHDQHEALTLADRIAVMREGRIVQHDTPDELWRHPRTAFVARFLGLDHVVDVEVASGKVTTPWGSLALPPPSIDDGTHQAVVLPSGLRLVHRDAPARPGELAVTGIVVASRFAGDHRRVQVRPERGPSLTVPIWHEQPPDLGTQVMLTLDPAALHLLASDGEDPDHPAPGS